MTVHHSVAVANAVLVYKMRKLLSHFIRANFRTPTLPLRCTKIRLAAGLCPDTMGKLTALLAGFEQGWGKGKIGRGRDEERWLRIRAGEREGV